MRVSFAWEVFNRRSLEPYQRSELPEDIRTLRGFGDRALVGAHFAWLTMLFALARNAEGAPVQLGPGRLAVLEIVLSKRE